MLKHLSSIFYLMVVLSLFSQCAPYTKITENDKYQLDPNFAGYKGTLIIVKSFENKRHYHHGADEKVVAAFQKNYKGEILSISEAELSKYTDLEKYRFFIKPEIITKSMGSNSNGTTNWINICYYVMKDRQTQKQYKTKEYVGPIFLEEFPIAFEALRASK
ncbi:MAG TPA: hypothetical protein VIM79_02375 [Niastella sp.]